MSSTPPSPFPTSPLSWGLVQSEALGVQRESALSLPAARAAHHQELPQTRLHGEDWSKGTFSGLFNTVLSQPLVKQKSTGGGWGRAEGRRKGGIVISVSLCVEGPSRDQELAAVGPSIALGGSASPVPPCHRHQSFSSDYHQALANPGKATLRRNSLERELGVDVSESTESAKTVSGRHRLA